MLMIGTGYTLRFVMFRTIAHTCMPKHATLTMSKQAVKAGLKDSRFKHSSANTGLSAASVQ